MIFRSMESGSVVVKCVSLGVQEYTKNMRQFAPLLPVIMTGAAGADGVAMLDEAVSRCSATNWMRGARQSG
jgi:hypothetical protein